MSKKLTVILASLLLVALWACQQQDDVVQLSPRSNLLESGAGSMFVSVTATGAWTLRVEYPAGADKDWASVTPASGTGSAADVRLKYDANPSEDPRSVSLVLSPGKGASVTVSLTQGGKAGAAVAGNYGYDVAPMDWLELPAMVEKDGLELLVHDMNGGKYKGQTLSGVRNWSCYWDYDAHLSLWVAYPLNNSLKGSGSRSNQWGWDALLPHNLQPDLTSGSYGGGWTRGHQIPSADRLATNAANVSTFVPTNMTPQQYDFNGGIWATLEGKVRSYAALSDTLYVVTGCLYKNSTKYTGGNSGFVVNVPTHYFKALLYRGSSKYATDGFMMAGFYLPHDASIANGNCMDYLCSIDELETKTGIDFFPNLKKRLGAEKADALEAAAPNASFWK